MRIAILPDPAALAVAAAEDAARRLRDALARNGRARLIAATGMSQAGMLENLVTAPGIDWTNVEMFHLDEYVGLPVDHPASFRKYLLERLIRPAGITRYHLLDGELDPAETCRAVGGRLQEAPVDLALVGIGENGHLAFNDPPADFTTDAPYITVRLDERCRRQQVGEGWFARLEDVPQLAISMTVKQILRSRAIVCTVPDRRKAEAVRDALKGPVDPMVPASILQTHADTAVYLDEESALLISQR